MREVVPVCSKLSEFAAACMKVSQADVGMETSYKPLCDACMGPRLEPVRRCIYSSLSSVPFVDAASVLCAMWRSRQGLFNRNHNHSSLFAAVSLLLL